MEDPVLESPQLANPSGFMAASRAATRVEEDRQRSRREKAIPSELPSQEGDYTPNPNVMVTIWQLPPYLQLVVTLMVNMVPASEEDRLQEKRGKKALAQSTSMITVVSFISLSKSFKVLYISSLTIFLSCYRGLWWPPGPARTA